MESIKLLPVMHRGAEQILIQCANLKSLNDAIRKLPAVRWSKTYKSWYLPLNKENYSRICNLLSNAAKLETKHLHDYLLKKKS